MDWGTIVSLVISQGIPVAQKLWELWSKGGNPTADDWNALAALGKQNARSNMLLALARNGIDPASPQGQALLALTPP